MNGDSAQADEDRGETYDSTSLHQSKKNSCKKSILSSCTSQSTKKA